jgi:hypothetical protein
MMLRKPSKTDAHPVSSDFIARIESIAGLMTKVETEYGGVSEMLESPEWDEGKTTYALRLVADIRRQLERLDEEMKNHASGKLR